MSHHVAEARQLFSQRGHSNGAQGRCKEWELLPFWRARGSVAPYRTERINAFLDFIVKASPHPATGYLV